MRRGTLLILFFIILLAAGASFVVFWPNTTYHRVKNPFTTVLGLDLQGGVSVQLEPKPGQAVTADSMQTTTDAINQRVNGPGVKEAIVRLQQTGIGGLTHYSIVVELPGYSGNQQSAFQTLFESGKLEFWNTGPSGGLQTGATFDPTQYTSYNPGNVPEFHR